MPAVAIDSAVPAGAGGAPVANLAPEPAAPAPFAARMTPVLLDITGPVSSKTSNSLDTFAFTVAEPVMAGDVVAIPAGATGVGEIVHAKKAGGMGAAGELVLAARYVELGGRRVRLRSTAIDAEGKSRVNGVNALAAAGAATILPVAVLGFFIKGGEIELPAGTRLIARLAEDFTPAASAAPVKPAKGQAQEDTAIAGAAADIKEGIVE